MCDYLVAFFLPPLGVFLKRGFHADVSRTTTVPHSTDADFDRSIRSSGSTSSSPSSAGFLELFTPGGSSQGTRARRAWSSKPFVHDRTTRPSPVRPLMEVPFNVHSQRPFNKVQSQYQFN